MVIFAAESSEVQLGFVGASIFTYR